MLCVFVLLAVCYVCMNHCIKALQLNGGNSEMFFLWYVEISANTSANLMRLIPGLYLDEILITNIKIRRLSDLKPRNFSSSFLPDLDF